MAISLIMCRRCYDGSEVLRWQLGAFPADLLSPKADQGSSAEEGGREREAGSKADREAGREADREAGWKAGCEAGWEA